MESNNFHFLVQSVLYHSGSKLIEIMNYPETEFIRVVHLLF